MVAVAVAGVGEDGRLPVGERQTAGAVEAGSIKKTAMARVEEAAVLRPVTSMKRGEEVAGAAENLKKMTWTFKRRTECPA